MTSQEKQKKIMKTLEQITAEQLLKLKAIKLQPSNPFTWASGWKSPIYCDNRKLMSYPDVRNFLKIQFSRIILEKYPNVEAIAGVATGAIAPAAIVADLLGLPFVYIRATPKGHGLENMIEGDLKPNQKVLDYITRCCDEKQVWWPYTSRYYLDMLFAADEPEMDLKSLEYIRNSFGHMATYETGTTSENWNGGSFMHESGAHPAYFMSAYVLGVRTQAAHEGLQLVIQPRLGDLKRAEGNVLCELGEVFVKWEKSTNNNLKFNFSIPENSEAKVYLPLQQKLSPKELIK